MDRKELGNPILSLRTIEEWVSLWLIKESFSSFYSLR
jgi:hypothetical protein